MATIKKGDVIKNMLCIDEKTPSGRVRLQCEICKYTGDYDRYNVLSAKQPCRMCRHFGKYTFDHVENMKKVKGYVENNNKVIGWTYRKENEDAMKFPLNTVVFKCNDCGNTFSIGLSALRSWGEVKCPYCNNKSKIVENIAKIKPVNKSIDSKKVIKNDIKDKNNEKDEAIKIKQNTQKNILESQLGSSGGYGIKDVKLEDKKDELVGKTFGTLTVLSAIVMKSGSGEILKTDKLRCKCTICGMEEEYNRYKVKNQQVTCKICKKMETKLYKGKNEQIRNMVGTVVNGLKITAQKENENGTWVGEYTCLYCKTKDKAALVKLSSKEVFCKTCMGGTGAKPVPIYCPECGNKINVNYRMLYGSRLNPEKASSTICPRCKHRIDHKVERALLDDQSTFRNVLNSYTKLGLGLNDIDTDSRLAKFGDVFVNRKGEKCYNCYCIEHRQELVLSESEIEEFDHKQCNCDDVNFYKLLNMPTKIKRKEKSIDDIMEEK